LRQQEAQHFRFCSAKGKNEKKDSATFSSGDDENLGDLVV